MVNLSSFIRFHATRSPQRIAVVFQDQRISYAELWRRIPDAMAFLRWLYTHPKILAERAAVLECREELLWEHEFEQRRQLVDREEATLKKIDDSLSAEIVRDRDDRHGRSVSPWLYASTPR